MTETHTYKPDMIDSFKDLAQSLQQAVEQMRPAFTAVSAAVPCCSTLDDRKRTTKAERRCAKHLLTHRRSIDPAAPKLGIAQAARQYRTDTQHAVQRANTTTSQLSLPEETGMGRAPLDPTQSHQTGPRTPCPFCAIVAGHAPATMLATWPDAVAFVPLGSDNDGHALIVPYRHIERPEHDYEVSATAWRRAIQYAVRQGGDYNLIVNAGQDATQTIPHLHLHYLPRRAGDTVALPWPRPAAPSVMPPQQRWFRRRIRRRR